ncbi:MAG TPA: Fe-S cluster assembly protein SufD [Cyclobacteriaceae bacterium]|nr:Fe-S cluster assembly protein SufD [Cyclobacteriaceae bacterium]
MNEPTVAKNITGDILSSLPSSTSVRESAKAVFQQLGLPNVKTEEYRHTPITRVLEKNFNFTSNQNPKASVQSIQDFTITDLDAYVVVILNGEFSENLSRISGGEVSIEKLSENKEQLTKYADFKTDALVAWNTAAWQGGVYIHIADNRAVSKPVVIYNIQDATDGEVKTFTRNLIVVGKNSEVTVVEKFDSIGSNPNFSNIVTEATVAENSGLNLYSIQADHGNRHQFGQTTIWQANHSRVNTYTFTLDGKFVRNNLQLLLDGEGCESHMYGLYLLHGETIADNHTVVDHRKPNSFSNELYKGVLEGNAKGVFNGKIFVRPQAQKTNAFQSNRNILLSEKATINTKPQLEIWADDVKCSHGCTTGQLDEEALFYLRSRGIEKNTARAMMLYAFAAEVLENIPNEKLKNFIDGMIGERLHKNF